MKETRVQKPRQERDLENLKRRMERFDTVVYDYLRRSHKTVVELAKIAGCAPSSLWRFRRKPEDFQKAPFEVICTCLRLANASSENVRFIIGLTAARGTDNEN